MTEVNRISTVWKQSLWHLPFDVGIQYSRQRVAQIETVTFSTDTDSLGNIAVVYIEFADNTFDEWTMFVPDFVEFDDFWNSWKGWGLRESGTL